MRKIILLAAILGLFAGANAQSEQNESKKSRKKIKSEKSDDGKPKASQEEKKHQEKLAKSKKTGKATLSRDTVYCSGNPYCAGKEVSKNLMGTVTVYNFHGFKTKEEEITVTLESVSSGSHTVYYWVWVSGDVRFETEQKENPVDLICYYYLYKDTVFNKKNFNTLKLSKGKSISGYNREPAPKQKDDGNLNRNRNDEIIFTGRDIRQSSVLIGHIESSTNTQGGNIITTYTIYNPDGNLVATAKNHGVTDHEWEIVTAHDNRTHNVTSTILHDQQDVVKQLVDLLYL